MEQIPFDFEQAGNETAEQIGTLKELTKEVQKQLAMPDVTPDEVGRWLTAIGKAILSIWK